MGFLSQFFKNKAEAAKPTNQHNDLAEFYEFEAKTKQQIEDAWAVVEIKREALKLLRAYQNRTPTNGFVIPNTLLSGYTIYHEETAKFINTKRLDLVWEEFEKLKQTQQS